MMYDQEMLKDQQSKLEKIATGISAVVIGVEYLLCYNNYDSLHASVMNVKDRFRWLPISESHFGDAPEIFTTIVASGFIGEKIKEYGENTSNTFLELCGKYFPTITAIAVGAYYTLGETILPQLLPGTADIKDVPAVLITAVASPLIAKYVISSWKKSWKNTIKNYIMSVGMNVKKLEVQE
ncbi:hypothetical protein COV11_02900 [Candidatus Woesearchaeota archaeon CG10_big_fil_rev_8_21_14_0_10_30_7]|nr:MAG: hypothetical protein COV11_02900 [Candidatus Woesearchaeota archaeon CG10_big_fil_rev_8_21_14_0_10_30_7]